MALSSSSIQGPFTATLNLRLRVVNDDCDDWDVEEDGDDSEHTVVEDSDVAEDPSPSSWNLCVSLVSGASRPAWNLCCAIMGCSSSGDDTSMTGDGGSWMERRSSDQLCRLGAVIRRSAAGPLVTAFGDRGPEAAALLEVDMLPCALLPVKEAMD